MTTSHGQESPSVKREGGDIMVSRTIQTPSASMHITGTLTEADRIYRLTLRSLLQNGYSSHHLTSQERALPGEKPPCNASGCGSKEWCGAPTLATCRHTDEVAELKKTIDRIIDDYQAVVKERFTVQEKLNDANEEVARLTRKVTALETMLSNVTSRTD